MHKSLVTGIGLVTSSLFLASTATAQLPATQVNAAGHGAQKQVIDVEGPAMNPLMLGVVELGGEFFVTGSRQTPNPVGDVYVFDSAGTLVRQFPQGPNATTAFGYRDGATDGVSIMFGYENGIEVMDTNGNPVAILNANNGPQAIVNPIAGAGLAANGNYRAVAYDPSGNGGNGSIWTANFGSDLLEIDLAGNVLTTFPNNSSWSIYGLARDPANGNLWANSIPNSGPIAEIDTTTGMPTGAAFSRNQAGSAQGGLSLAGANDLVGLDQGTPDSITVYRNHLYPGAILGKNEPQLLTGVNGAVPDRAQFKVFRGGDTVSWQVTQGGVPGIFPFPSLITFNFDNDAGVNGSTSLFPGGPAIPEFVALSPSSSPPGFALYSAVLSGGLTNALVPNGFLAGGSLARLQALSFVPGVGLLASNQQYLQSGGTAVGIVVEAVGTNSFNSITTSGFWRVIHPGGAVSPIASIRFDFAGRTSHVFDTDQTGMADRFDGGDLQPTGCLNTYRNGSAVATGLVFAGTNASPCDPAATGTGFIGSGSTTTSYPTLDFSFAGGLFTGNTFEFDCDTDGGGISGGAHAGMGITITLMSGETILGVLEADPANPDRAFANM